MTDRLDLSALSAFSPTGVESDPDEQAAVLVPVLDSPGADHVLFTERSPDLSHHAGEMSFPGGGRDAADADLLDTALREASEEVGLDPATASVVGRLDDVPGPFGHVVRPFVARVPDREYVPDGREIVATAVLSVADLTDPVNFYSESHVGPDGSEAVLPHFAVDGCVVWGLTGMVLAQLLELTAGWERPSR